MNLITSSRARFSPFWRHITLIQVRGLFCSRFSQPLGQVWLGGQTFSRVVAQLPTGLGSEAPWEWGISGTNLRICKEFQVSTQNYFYWKQGANVSLEARPFLLMHFDKKQSPCIRCDCKALKRKWKLTQIFYDYTCPDFCHSIRSFFFLLIAWGFVTMYFICIAGEHSTKELIEFE